MQRREIINADAPPRVASLIKIMDPCLTKRGESSTMIVESSTTRVESSTMRGETCRDCQAKAIIERLAHEVEKLRRDRDDLERLLAAATRRQHELTMPGFQGGVALMY